MIIPPQVKINGFTWQVVLSKDVAHEGNAFGSTHHHSQTIFLDPSNTEQKQAHTFLHELTHAALFSSGLDGLYGDNLKDMSEEDIVRTISMLLYQVLKDNELDFSS